MYRLRHLCVNNSNCKEIKLSKTNSTIVFNEYLTFKKNFLINTFSSFNIFFSLTYILFYKITKKCLSVHLGIVSQLI